MATLNRFATGLLAGLLVAGCGTPPRLASAPTVATPVQAAATGTGMSVDGVFMPPLEVFKTFDQEKTAFITAFRKANDLKFAAFMPNLETQRLKMGRDKVGYLVTAHGNCAWNPATNGGAKGAFAVTFAYAPSGQALGYSSSFFTLTSGVKAERKPAVVSAKQTGPLTLTVLMEPPAELKDTLTALRPEQTRKLAARFKSHKVLPLTNFPFLLEIKYNGEVAGYIDTQVTGAIGASQTFLGIEAVNFLDASGMELLAQGRSLNPANPLAFQYFPI